MNELPDFDPLTLALIGRIETITRQDGSLARVQYALASCLWRSISRNPSLAASIDFILSSIHLTAGGRRIDVELTVFPPKPEPKKIRRRTP